ncbi:MAG: hypothetical protein QM756_07705 [Polyangiaceae bacterium]
MILLSEHGDAASLERLQASLESEGGNADLADAIERGVSSLKSVAPQRAARVIDALYERGNSEQKVALLQNSDGLGSLALATCKKGLASDDPDVVMQALSLAEQLTLPALAEQLVSIARDAQRDTSVRQRAAFALRALGGPLLRQNQRLVDELDGSDGTRRRFGAPGIVREGAFDFGSRRRWLPAACCALAGGVHCALPQLPSRVVKRPSRCRLPGKRPTSKRARPLMTSPRRSPRVSL